LIECEGQDVRSFVNFPVLVIKRSQVCVVGNRQRNLAVLNASGSSDGLFDSSDKKPLIDALLDCIGKDDVNG
jgi:hypothetical protein